MSDDQQPSGPPPEPASVPKERFPMPPEIVDLIEGSFGGPLQIKDSQPINEQLRRDPPEAPAAE